MKLQLFIQVWKNRIYCIITLKLFYLVEMSHFRHVKLNWIKRSCLIIFCFKWVWHDESAAFELGITYIPSLSVFPVSMVPTPKCSTQLYWNTHCLDLSLHSLNCMMMNLMWCFWWNIIAGILIFKFSFLFSRKSTMLWRKLVIKQWIIFQGKVLTWDRTQHK